MSLALHDNDAVPHSASRVRQNHEITTAQSMMKPYYERGPVKLWHCDCRELIPSIGSVDAVVTDPPYGIFACGGKWGKKADLQWDREPATFISEIVGLGQWAIVWGGNYFELPPSRGWLVWHKRDRVASAADVELAWTSMDMNARLIDQTIAATNAERCGHPTQKPLRVMEWSLGFVPQAKVILDPFFGSGTTAVAAIRGGREFVGCELEEKYCEMAARRCERELEQGKLFDAPKPKPAVQKSLMG